jgi:hypothetical protein
MERGFAVGEAPAESPRLLEFHMEKPPPRYGEGFMVELSGVEPLTSCHPLHHV